MRRFLVNIIWSALVFSCIYLFVGLVIVPPTLTYLYGATTQEQIDLAFSTVVEQEYDTIVLGNSHASFGVDPSVFKSRVYNFSHVNDSYNQCFYKLDYLDRKDKLPKVVILIIDYFQFGVFSDSRNYAYQNYFPAEYLSDYPKKNYTALHLWNQLNPLKLNKLQFGTKVRTNKDGFQIKLGQRYTGDSKVRKMEWNNVQISYFNKIAEFCLENKIRLYLFMQPIQSKELSQYTKSELDQFDAHIKTVLSSNNQVYFYNYSNRVLPSEYYSDNTHLNPFGAQAFSLLIDSTLSSEIRE